MTDDELRDLFAIHARTEELDLPDMCARGIFDYLGIRSPYGSDLPKGYRAMVHAKARYEFADAMMRERAKRKDR